MIQFMSSYQKTGKDGKHYHPYGALFWFSCNQYGDPTGKAVYVKKVPEWRYIYDFSNRGFQQLKKMREKKPELKELLTSETQLETMKYTDTKMQLYQ